MPFPPPTERQARLIWIAATGLAIAVILGLIAVLIWGLGRVLNILSPVLWPLAVAGVIAYLLDPVVDWFEKKGLTRTRAIICVFAIAFLVLGAIFGSVVPRVVSETRQLIERIPEIAAKLEQSAESFINKPPNWFRMFVKDRPGQTPAGTSGTNAPAAVGTNDVPATTAATGESSSAIDRQTLDSARGWLASTLPEVGQWLLAQLGKVASWFGILVGLALVPVYAFYLLLEKRGIESRWTDYLPLSKSTLKDEIVFVLRSINGYLVAFFRGQVLVAICDAILYTIGFLAIGLQYAAVLGFAAVFLTLIPFLGAIVLSVAAVSIALVQYGDWLHPLLVLGVFGVVQTLEGFVIAPKIIGDRVGLHPLTIIIAVMVGTTLLGGLLGGILAIPLTAVLRVLMARYVWKSKKMIDAADTLKR